MDFRSTAVKPYHQLETEEDDDQEEKDEEPEGTNNPPEVPRRNPGRNRQLPKCFRQNVANISKLIQC